MSAIATESPVAAEQEQPVHSAAEPAPERTWERFGIPSLAFLFISLGFLLSLSWNDDDALDTARWMQEGNLRALVEYRHLTQRLLPLWLWKGLLALGIHVRTLSLLSAWDLVSGVLAVMLFYRILMDLVGSRVLSFAGTFGFATAHAMWLYTGSGRLYSTSMLLILAAYFLVLQLDNPKNLGRWLRISFAAGVYICFACFFWLTHAFAAISVGLLLLLLPARNSWSKRLRGAGVYAVTGLLVGAVVAVSCIHYAGIPLTKPGLHDWFLAAGTQPLQFDALSLMKASYGQADGILVMDELPYMINGVLLKDRALAHIASFPWQVFKFGFVWVLLLLAYLYPLFMLRRASHRLRAVIVALYVPLAINMYFGLGWLGSDMQRFMPTMPSQFALAVIAVQDLLARVPRPRIVGSALAACLVFIAGCNLMESMLPLQHRYMILKQEMLGIHPLLHPQDLLFSFGRDLSVTYLTMTTCYAGALYLNTTNDSVKWYWDRRDWQAEILRRFDEVRASGGHVYAMDRILFGLIPPDAAWSEKQHPRPTVKQFGEFLQSKYCLAPAFPIEGARYYELEPRTDNCPAIAIPTGAPFQP